MSVALLASADDFLAQTNALRSADPFRTNILGSVATAVASGSLTYDDYLWWVVTDSQGQVIGAAMRTAPHGMVLSPMSMDAVFELANVVSIHDDGLPSVSGPTLVVEAFIDQYKSTQSMGSLRNSEIEEQHLLYALNELSIPSVEGGMAIASTDDYDLLLKWYMGFEEDTGHLIPNPEGSIRAGLGRNSYRFWVIGGEKVSLAGHAPTLNPTSNGIYQKIGFEKIDEDVLFAFSVENA